MRDAAADYLSWHEAKHTGILGLRSIRANINAHILSELGDIECKKLTREKIIKWFHAALKSGAHSDMEGRKAAGVPGI